MIRRIHRRAARGLVAVVALGLVGRGLMPGLGREIRLRRAERAVASGRLVEAEDQLQRLIQEKPDEVRARLLGVEVARRSGRITEAEEALQRAVELGLPIETGRREHALLTAGHDFAAAEPSLRRWLADHPDDREVRRALTEGLARDRRSDAPRGRAVADKELNGRGSRRCPIDGTSTFLP